MNEFLEASSCELGNIRHALDKSAIVAITNRAGNIVHVNDKFCEISKYVKEELLGQNHRIINSNYHNQSFFIEMWKTITSGKIWEGEIRNRAKDGSFYWVYTTIVPFLDSNGEPYQYASIRYEITHRKKAEEQLRIYADQLEQTIQTVLDREAQILMQDRLASVGLLASSLAHEIGTPLGVVRGRAEYLGMQFEEPIVKKNVNIIISQIDRVSKLIRSLLNLARGDQIKNIDKIDLSLILNEVMELITYELRKSNIEIRNELPKNTPISVKADAGPLHQVFLNLLVNSVHAIESAVKAGRNSGHFIRIFLTEEKTQLNLSIQDTGCGISENNLKNIFKPFFTTKDIGMGTGLGLATSYRIVESWGGYMTVQSQEGKGTAFQILFPKVI